MSESGTPEASVDKGAAEALAAEANVLWAQREDLGKAEAAIQKWHDAAKANPTDPAFHRDLAYAYYFLNNVHFRWTDDSDRRRKNYEAGVVAAEKALALANPAFAGKIRSGEDTDKVLEGGAGGGTEGRCQSPLLVRDQPCQMGIGRQHYLIVKVQGPRVDDYAAL